MLIPGTITVTFTANYTGPHRICWRQCGVGSYVCTNIVDCVGGGNVCSATISVMVDPETCNPVCFEGYIQATCNPEGSGVGQVPWTATFTPNPTCKLYALTCANPISPCAPILAADMGLNCSGTARPTVGPIYANSSVYLCSTGVIPGLPAEYTMTEVPGACCYNCGQYEITLEPLCENGCLLDGSSIYYVDCNTRELVRLDFTGSTGSTFQICAVIGSVSLQIVGGWTASSTLLGNCP